MNNHKRPILIVGGVLLGAALAVALAVGSANAGSAPAKSDTAGMSAAKAARKNAEAPKPAKASVQKPSVAQGRARAQAQARAGTQSMAGTSAQSAMTPGIVNLRQGPFPASIFASNNMYRARIGSAWVFAYAGTVDPQGDRQAALRIYQLPDGGKLTLVGVFPAGTGGLTVASASGTTLTVTDAGGATLAFDLATMKFA